MPKAGRQGHDSGAEGFSQDEWQAAHDRIRRRENRGLSLAGRDRKTYALEQGYFMAAGRGDLGFLEHLLNLGEEATSRLVGNMLDHVVIWDRMWGQILRKTGRGGAPTHFAESVFGATEIPDPFRDEGGLRMAIAVVRAIGLRLAHLGTPLQFRVEENGEKFIRLRLLHEEALILVLLANMPARGYGLSRTEYDYRDDDMCTVPLAVTAKERREGLFMEAREVSNRIGPLDPLVRAARGLWPLMLAEAQLHRCPAIAPGATTETRTCGRYFITAGGRGRPQKYCSDTCRKRAQRWRKEHGPEG